jgi:predicted 2-oxoglutarate/Fe(II)-dependent dioxygenase YbiX
MLTEHHRSVSGAEISHLTRHVYAERFFSPEECDQIAYLNLSVQQAEVNEHLEDAPRRGLLNLRHRNALNKAIPRRPEYEWIYARLIHRIQFVNDYYYRLAVTRLTDPQILEYQHTGFYGTHVDLGVGEISHRKLTMIAFLTPPDEYEGGELMLKPAQYTVPQPQGALVIFPAWIPHEVKPVTAGIRRSLVTWVIGPCVR